MTSSRKILLLVVIVAVGVGAIPPSIKRQGLYFHHFWLWGHLNTILRIKQANIKLNDKPQFNVLFSLLINLKKWKRSDNLLLISFLRPIRELQDKLNCSKMWSIRRSDSRNNPINYFYLHFPTLLKRHKFNLYCCFIWCMLIKHLQINS